MFINFLRKIVKAIIRRIIWKLNSLLTYFGFSLILLNVSDLRGLHLSRRTPTIEIQSLLNRLRPIKNGHELLRVGDTKDGGYLIPSDLEGIVRCLSAGCDLNWTFEKSLHSKYGIESSILDSEDKRPSDLGTEHTYVAKWLGNSDTDSTIKFNTWIAANSKNSNDDLLLQMDIEGFEWEALEKIDIESLRKFRIISIEFHSTQNLYNNKLFQSVYSPVIQKLLSLFDVVHIHPNNCCGATRYGDLEFPNIFELTLHRKNRSVGNLGYTTLPSPLDVKNVDSNPDLFIVWSDK
jgi:hypothetical protein